MASLSVTRQYQVADPPLARFLFSDRRMAWLWLIVRVYAGIQWILAGEHKVTDPNWLNGSSLLAYWKRAVAIPAQGSPPISFDWYRGFLQGLIDSNAHVWFGPVVSFGEILVGVGLILGALTGIAAFFGALMNMNFMLAGSASTNPVLFLLAGLIMLAWKIAGYWGADRFLLPLVGVPWKGGVTVQEKATVDAGT
jgi:thiosulfate dehydrogenase (quinone) large subunit